MAFAASSRSPDFREGGSCLLQLPFGGVELVLRPVDVAEQKLAACGREWLIEFDEYAESQFGTLFGFGMVPLQPCTRH